MMPKIESKHLGLVGEIGSQINPYMVEYIGPNDCLIALKLDFEPIALVVDGLILQPGFHYMVDNVSANKSYYYVTINHSYIDMFSRGAQMGVFKNV